MPSRKRAKGRERKLKQEAQESVERCYHGIVPLPEGHPVSVIVDSFIKTMRDCRVSVHESLQMTHEKHEDVWEDDTITKMVIDRMVSIGTTAIKDKCIAIARMISEAIVFLESCCEDTYHSALSKAREDLTYIRSAGERELVRFYKKRIPCSCLDE